MLIKTRDNETGAETNVFEADVGSSFMIQRCQSCDQIHLLLFKHKDDKVATACIDMTDGFAEQLIAKLIRLLAEKFGTFPPKPGNATIN